MAAPTLAEEEPGEETTTTETNSSTTTAPGETSSGIATTAPGESSSAATTVPGESSSSAVAYGKYKAVEGFKNLYEALDAQGNSRSPKEYIFSTVVPVDGSAPPERAKPAHAKGTAYYVQIVDGSGVFLALNADGSFSFTDVIWWGPDGKFGTADDQATSIKEENGYYYWKQAEGVWQMIWGIYNPERTTAAGASSSVTAAPDGSSTTENDFLSGGEADKPKTGKEAFNPGLAACMALLLMGCAYCGFQAFRRRAVRSH